RTIASVDTTHTDSVPTVARQTRVGNGRISGSVVAITDGRPLANAQISISGGPRTRANDRGEWTLSDAPAGTRMIEVRAVGYYPERRTVDIIPGAPAVRVALFTFKAMLDTVRTTAGRVLYGSERAGFDDRRRNGLGYYMTDNDIEK